MKKIILTGGAGFGGSGLIKEMLKRNYEVKVIDIISPNHADNLRHEIDEDKIEYVWKAVHDIRPDDIEGYDIICHFAAQADVPMGFSSAAWTAWENIYGTVCVLEAAKEYIKAGGKIEKFLLPSSGNAIGRPLYTPIDELHPLTPHNPYSASKAAQELYGQAYLRAYNIPVVTFRNGIVYGPGMRRDIFIYIWFKNIILGKPVVLEGGDQTRDPCYVTDTVDAWARAVEAEPADVIGKILHVSRGKEYRVDDILEKVIKCSAESGYPEPEIIKREYRPGEQGQRECFSINNTKRILGYDPKIDLEEGLKLTLRSVESDLGL